MKILAAQFSSFIRSRRGRRNIRLLLQMLAMLALLVIIYSVLFHYIMRWEYRHHEQRVQYSWVTGFYWTLTVMSTLGFGDITFQSDLGKMFSIIVLLSGTMFMLILLPFTFIQFFYAPWVEAQAAARAPRALPEEKAGHVLLTDYGPVATALISKLNQFGYPYSLLELREPLPYDCSECGTEVSARFNYCPNCMHNLHPACPQCNREVHLTDHFCPYCSNDLSLNPDKQKQPGDEGPSVERV